MPLTKKTLHRMIEDGVAPEDALRAYNQLRRTGSRDFDYDNAPMHVTKIQVYDLAKRKFDPEVAALAAKYEELSGEKLPSFN